MCFIPFHWHFIGHDIIAAMKTLVKTALIIYLLLLLWLVLFKTSLDIVSVLTEHQTRSISMIPFSGRLSEMLENFIVFIPLGLLLGAAFRETAFWKKFAFIFTLSLAIETIQYVLAIGISDITDIITNTLGGLLGLIVYKVSTNRRDSEKINRIVLLTTAILVILCLSLRFFVFRVKY